MQLSEGQNELIKFVYEKKLFLIDLDGTIYLGDKLIKDSDKFINILKKKNKEYVFMTNNSSKSKQQYVEKLNDFGMGITEENIFSSNEATSLYLKKKFSNARVLYMGTDESANEMMKWGIDVSIPCKGNYDEPFDVAVLAYDTTMTYEKLATFCLVLRKGIPFLSSHPDLNCPSIEGPLPDNGSFIELIATSTGRRPEAIIGKPNFGMIEIALNKYNLQKNDMIIIGDRLYTDIKMGYDNDVDTLLVLSGETKEKDVAKSDISPSYIIESLGKLSHIL